MQKDWYKVTLKFQEVVEEDKVKIVKEEYLFQGISYADAENRALEYHQALNNGCEIDKVVKMTVHELFDLDLTEETWYKVKVQYIIFDEKSKSEKRTPVVFLCKAGKIYKVAAQLRDKLGTVEDYEITDINKTKILEVYPLEANANQNGETDPEDVLG